MRIRLSRHAAGISIASVGAATLLLTGAAAGSPLENVAGEQAILPPTCLDGVVDCPSPSPSSTASTTESPSEEPSETESASEEPSEEPSESVSPTGSPSPTECPTGSESPSEEPSEDPSEEPSEEPSPSDSPTAEPNPVESLLSMLPVAPVPGVSTSASEDPSAEPSESTTVTPPTGGCEVPGTKTALVYAATQRVPYAHLYTFSAKVNQAGGVPVPAGEVHFMLPGHTFRAPVRSDGYARVQVRLTMINPGNYRMNLLYVPAPGYEESRLQVGFQVVRTTTSCDLYRQVTATTSRLTGAVRYPDRSRVAGVGVVFWYNGRPIANRVTNSIGVATLETTRGRSGDTFMFAYPGDSKRAGCSRTITVP